MSRASRDLARATLLVLLAGLLQGSSCKTHFCSGDACDDEDEDDVEGGGRIEVLVLPPLRDPFGRPMTSPIPVWLRRP